MSSVQRGGGAHASQPPEHTGGERAPDARRLEEIHSSPEFQQLRSRLLRFVFPMAALFLAWYFLYVLLAAYAEDFMATEVFGNVNLGILLGLGQFLSTLLITVAYVRFANRSIDPLAEQLRDRVQDGAR